MNGEVICPIYLAVWNSAKFMFKMYNFKYFSNIVFFINEAKKEVESIHHFLFHCKSFYLVLEL